MGRTRRRYGAPYNARVTHRLRSVKRRMVQQPWKCRGVMVRKRYKRYDFDSMSAAKRYTCAQTLKVPTDDRHTHTKGRASRSPMLDKYLHAVKQANLPSYATGGFAVWCAARIQAYWRMSRHFRRYTLSKFSLYQIAALQIQYMWRQFQHHKYVPVSPTAQGQSPHTHRHTSPSNASVGDKRNTENRSALSKEDRAAIIIQLSWRKFTNKRIYRYYRDLIQFRLTGEPRELLKSINPREAGLFDKSTGIHVRFRLAGSTFPPTLVYKIYIMKPLCDVGAFAPRDYTKCKAPNAMDIHSSTRDARQKHNHRNGDSLKGQIRVGGSYFGTQVSMGPEGTANWYRRVENNEWRPVTQRVIHETTGTVAPGVSSESLYSDLGGRRSGESGVPFHFSRLHRQADVALRRKRKKRQWLLDMYRKGLAAEKDGQGGFGVSKGYGQMENSEETKGLGFVDDVDLDGELGDELEDMLNWSKELDYDAYVANWHTLATSAPAGSDYIETGDGGSTAQHSSSMGGFSSTYGSQTTPYDDTLQPDWEELASSMQLPAKSPLHY